MTAQHTVLKLGCASSAEMKKLSALLSREQSRNATLYLFKASGVIATFFFSNYFSTLKGNGERPGGKQKVVTLGKKCYVWHLFRQRSSTSLRGTHDSDWLNNMKEDGLTIRRQPATTTTTTNRLKMEEVAVEKLVVDVCGAHKLWILFFVCLKAVCCLYSLLIEAETFASHCENKTAFHYQSNMWLRQHFNYKSLKCSIR